MSAVIIPFPRAPMAALREAEQRLIARCANGGSRADRAVLAELQLSLAIAHAGHQKDPQLIYDETLIRVCEERGEITNDTACQLFHEAVIRYYHRQRLATIRKN